MKRLNPTTGVPFKRGDSRIDGYIFKEYLNRVRKDGFNQELWVSKSVYSRCQIQERKNASNWAKQNPSIANSKNAKHRGLKINRTPAWLTLEQHSAINKFYTKCTEITKLTGISHHVDHIIPLQGKTVSGLHVPWNLQILPALENCSKGNRF